MTESVITLENLNCRVGQHQVLRVDHLQIQPGQHWCLYGGNGAGKSLLASVICRRWPVPGEQLRFADNFDPVRDIREVSFEEQQRLWLWDNRHDISEFTASAQDAGTSVAALIGLAHSGESSPGSKDDAICTANHAGAVDILEHLDIAHLLTKGIRFLSSGQFRRVMLARAMYQNPRLLILDNPLESIDRNSAERIVSAIRAWMTPLNNLLLLSRRQQNIVPGITHLALLDQLALVAAGDLKSMLASEDFARLASRQVTVPEKLPSACPGRPLPEAIPGEPLIALRGVDVAYGTQPIFRSLYWDMSVGDHVLIEGPNGTGKSTLLSLIDGDNHKAYGQPVYLFGRKRGSGETVWDVKARFGVISNELHNRYIKGWRVLDVVVSGFFDSIGLYDETGASEIAAARAWLDTVASRDIERCYYHELSYGQQRLVLLARAMVKQPLILILDEPCVGLDDYHRTLLLKLLDKIAQGGRTQLIYVSHTQGEAPGCITHKMSLTKGVDGGETQVRMEAV